MGCNGRQGRSFAVGKVSEGTVVEVSHIREDAGAARVEEPDRASRVDGDGLPGDVDDAR